MYPVLSKKGVVIIIKDFKSLCVYEKEKNIFETKIVKKSINDLPDDEVLIKVLYSSLNYKDALAINGNKGIVRKFPHTPGIDAAGLVEKDITGKFKNGDEVIITGFDLGTSVSGGYQKYIKIPSSWIVKKPENISLRDTMIYGTAGFTAALSVLELSSNLHYNKSQVLVTGASGGVGSIALLLLNKLGYNSISATRKSNKNEFLKKLNTNEIISVDQLIDEKKMLLSVRYNGCIDTVGGMVLSNVLKHINYKGVVTTCGNASGHKLETNVYPFILRAIKLIGIDSVKCDMQTRYNIWNRLSQEWKLNFPEWYYQEIELDEVKEYSEKLLNGENSGRIIIRV